MTTDVTPDGSPVPVYLRLPAEPEFSPVLAFLGPSPRSVLDLGCGVGRLANELARRGCAVTGVDESQAMLDHLDPRVEGIRARLEDLRLDRWFDAVVLASHLVNVADDGLRRSWLAAAARHVAPGGSVLVQHWRMPPAVPADSDTEVGGVGVAFKVLGLDGTSLHGRVTYTLGARSWAQTFHARLLDEDALATELGQVGLRPFRRLSPVWLAAWPAV